MKSIFILLIAIILTSCNGITQEPVALELEFRGPCSSLVPMISSITTSSFTSPGCLPITLNAGNPDLDDLDSHYHCVDVRGGRRSIFRFVEVFVRGTYSDSAEAAESLPAGVTFIPSIISKVPFRVVNSPLSGQVSYWLRPSCSVSTDVCNGVTQIVNNCTPRRATVVEGYVYSDERVYIVLPNQVVQDTCHAPAGQCCSYISTALSGICGGNQGNLCAGVTCNDNNNCTIDTCNPNNGNCSYTPKTCNDNIACTTDSCDGPSGGNTGQCVYAPNNTVCNDNIDCTIDLCNQNTASGCSNTPNNTACDDGYSCTLDLCNQLSSPGSGCSNTPENSNCPTMVTCSTGNCAPNGTNQATGGCTFSFNNTICNDGFSCTSDSCDPGAAGANATTGCLNTPDDLFCNDNILCTIDTCSPNAFFFSNCTQEFYNSGATTGCLNTPNDVVCYDNSSCTTECCDPGNGDPITGCDVPNPVFCEGSGCLGGCQEMCIGNFPLNPFGTCNFTELNTASCYLPTYKNNARCAAKFSTNQFCDSVGYCCTSVNPNTNCTSLGLDK